jgi:hypothetical protein
VYVLKVIEAGTPRGITADKARLPDGARIVSLISFLIGLILAFVGAIQLRQFGAQIYIADRSPSAWPGSGKGGPEGK